MKPTEFLTYLWKMYKSTQPTSKKNNNPKNTFYSCSFSSTATDWESRQSIKQEQLGQTKIILVKKLQEVHLSTSHVGDNANLAGKQNPHASTWWWRHNAVGIEVGEVQPFTRRSATTRWFGSKHVPLRMAQSKPRV